MNQMTCLEVMVLFALTLKKREKNTKIFTFVAKNDNLLPLKITAGMTFEEALAYCQEHTVCIDLFFHFSLLS